MLAHLLHVALGATHLPVYIQLRLVLNQVTLGLRLTVVELDRRGTGTVLLAVNLASPKVRLVVLGWLVAAVELLTRADSRSTRFVLSTVVH